MRNLKIPAALAIVGLVLIAGWQIGAAVVANVELRDDLQDIASQLSLRVGLPSAPNSDDEFRNAVIQRAKQYDVSLEPDQVTVQRTGYGPRATLYLQASYTVPIRMFGYEFQMHFTPESGKRLSQ
ncbi:MAG TPA: hypothetical protein VJ731_12495 [Terriglobales bacterium]|nr:hypothetical protein [Terriglobales bacterium]